MEERHDLDWKDVVETYFEKCVAITLLFTVFVFIVFPNVETAVIRSTEKVMETIEILPEIPEEIKPPEAVVQPIVKIEIVDDEVADDDVRVIDTIEKNVVPEEVIIAPPIAEIVLGATPKFVPYEDAPVILSGPQPAYPDQFRKMKINGQVILDIEVLSDGSIGAIEVLKSLMAGEDGFDEAAIKAVRQWRLQPAKSGGNAVACWIKQSFNFTTN